MEILGIGPLEFLFVIIILLLVLGPADLVTLGQKAGAFIRKVRASETWIMVSNLSRALRNLPNTLADETGTDDILREVMGTERRRPVRNISMDEVREIDPGANRIRPPGADAFSSWTTPAAPGDSIQAEPPAPVEGAGSPDDDPVEN